MTKRTNTDGQKYVKSYMKARKAKKESLKKPMYMPKNAGGSLKDVPANNTGLGKLPTKVRNKMGYKEAGGKIGSVGGRRSTRGTPEQAKRMYNSEKAKMKEFNEYMDYVESQLSDNRGGKKR